MEKALYCRLSGLLEQRHGADCMTPTLRFSFRQRLMPSVRPQGGRRTWLKAILRGRCVRSDLRPEQFRGRRLWGFPLVRRPMMFVFCGFGAVSDACAMSLKSKFLSCNFSVFRKE